MDYISKQLDKKINFLEKSTQYQNELRIYYQSKIEYILIFALAYLWNKNFENLDLDKKQRVAELIIHPTLGQILEINRTLDIEKEIFDRKVNNLFDEYLKIRNLKIGHGYTYEDKSEDLCKDLKELLLKLKSKNIFFLNQDIDLIVVNKFSNDFFQGIAYRVDSDFDHWSCPLDINDFEENNLYGLTNDNAYFRLSPFISLVSDDEYYIFNSISEKLTGKVKYNRLKKTGSYYQEWEDFCSLYIENDNLRKRSHNGTIINIFETNYKKYIDVGVKEKIKQFIIKNKASVAATIWGHGGVGKTASIQRVCEELININDKYFDYIIFLSAKDRLYKKYTGDLQSIDNAINSFEQLIRNINLVICQENKYDLDEIYNFGGKLLLVIDDYETFSIEDKDRIEDFIKQLDINHHKVIITTRANLVVGYEIQTNELKKEETTNFLVQIQNIEFSECNFINESDLTDKVINQVHTITSGRPLFIFQFAYIVAQRGLTYGLSQDLKSNDKAIEFLYGRIYEYLSKIAQDIFVVMGLLTADSDGDLTNLLEKNKYILSLEHRESEFDAAVKELEKLRIIEIIEAKFFRIYSTEIQEIMMKYYHRRDSNFKGNITNRLNQVSRDKKLDNEVALLKNANASRLSRSEIEVVSSYRHILNRQSNTHEIKIQAVLNLGSYLFADKGNKDEAIKVFDEYFTQFSRDSQFIKMYSSYSWAKGGTQSRKKAIQILLDYFSQSEKRMFHEDINFDLLGTLLINRSIYWIGEREQTKARYDRKEISNKEYKNQLENQKDKFIDIFKNQGNRLFELVKTKGYANLNSGSRQSVAAGLYQFVEICIRLQKHQKGIEVCNFASKNLPEYYRNQFHNKLQLIRKFQIN